MKKLIALILAMVCMMSLVACGDTKQESVVYSFHGENEYFEVSNGVIVFNTEEELFEGGDLKVIDNSIFNEIASFSTVFYVIENGNKKTILHNETIDMTGRAVNLDGGLGSISGNNAVLSNKVSLDELKYNLWFELKTTDLDGKENTYQMQLILNNVTNYEDDY